MSRNALKADLAVFPECFVTGYGYADAETETLEIKKRTIDSETARGSSFQFISQVAIKFNIAIVYGFAEVDYSELDDSDDKGRYYIAMNWVNADGTLQQTYRKSHLWTPSVFESDNFQPNSETLSPIVNICGVKVGCLICFDVEVAEPARCLALDGADLLLVIGANQDPFTLEHVVKVRAFENMCHLIYCNQMEAPLIGSSVGVDPTGAFLPNTPLARGEADETVVVIDIKNEAWKRAAERNPLFAVRQPHLYTSLTRDSQKK